MSLFLTKVWNQFPKLCPTNREKLIRMTSWNKNILRVTGLCAGNSPVTGEFPPPPPPPQGQWRGALMFSLICAWTDDWVNNRNAGDLRRHGAHYNVTIMYEIYQYCIIVMSYIGINTAILIGCWCYFNLTWIIHTHLTFNLWCRYLGHR